MNAVGVVHCLDYFVNDSSMYEEAVYEKPNQWTNN